MTNQDKAQDEEIRAQIARLEAQLSSNKPEERLTPSTNVLVPDSPQKKAKAAKAAKPNDLNKPPAASGSLGSSCE